MDKPSLQRLFSTCDINKSGVIEYEDFTVVCRELNVPEEEIKTLFNKFGASEDGCINYSNFSSRFQEVSETLDLASFGASPQSQGSPWEEFQSRMDDATGLLSGRLRDQLAELHQAMYIAEPLLLQQYEGLVDALVSESKDHRLESEQLETSLRRTEELNTSQLTELEDDMQQQLACVEVRVREEEHKRMEGVMAALQRRHENEVADLHTVMDRLLKSQGESELNSSRQDVDKLQNQISELTQEKEQLRTSLFKAQTNISILQVEMDKLKNMYADQKLQHERESDELKKMVIEYQSYSSHIEILQAMNKKLYDSNDGLRSALVNDVASSKRRLSPNNEIPARRMKPVRQSTLINSEGAHTTVGSSKTTNSHVASWADTYPDSGVSLPMDTTESSGSESDSDDSTETVHHSYSYVPSDIEISDVKLEASQAILSVAPSKASSIASSIRRRLSAFPMKQTEADLVDTGGPECPGPMYRLVLAGDAGSGKSSFLLRLSLNEFRGDIQTTLGVDFQIKKMLVDGEKTNLQIWDTAGQERFRSIARSYFRKAHGVLLLYDVTSESSFLNVREWMDQIQESTDEQLPMCVIGNKVDLREDRPEGSCVSTVDGERLARTYNALFCETSAKEGTNIVEAVLHLAREVKKNVKLRRQSESQVKLSLSSSKKALTNCCRV
ncbi:ras and EF-hand domain-containing protein-like isoform X2 [Oncorhynchus nerka]|uniref:ras and EF-hand domain-containing protein-like isoform X2 n=1 Tax=Oncorhynchus nerka TaxID=8023 RepID=UPI001131A60A|nr:ras and EF-hand domain-containing protein-like isoform X2 [Oncorhynchus nerka]